MRQNGRGTMSRLRRYADGLSSLCDLENAHQAILPDLLRLVSDRRLREHLQSRCAPVRRQIRRLDLLIGALPSGGQAPRLTLSLPDEAPVDPALVRRTRNIARRDLAILDLSAWLCEEKLRRYQSTRLTAGILGYYEAATHLLCSAQAEASAGERLDGVRLRMVVDEGLFEMERAAS